MSTATETRIPLAETERIADELVQLLEPVCERIRIAGSIRRRRPDVGDIELVAIPKIERLNADLFGEKFYDLDLLHLHCEELLAGGEFQLRLDVNGVQRFGAKAKYLWYQGVKLDLFTATESNWGSILAIRTGPMLFSRWLVTSQRQGGAMPADMQMKGGQLRVGLLETVVPTPTEQALFAALELPYREPWEREAPVGWIPPGERGHT